MSFIAELLFEFNMQCSHSSHSHSFSRSATVNDEPSLESEEKASSWGYKENGVKNRRPFTERRWSKEESKKEEKKSNIILFIIYSFTIHQFHNALWVLFPFHSLSLSLVLIIGIISWRLPLPLAPPRRVGSVSRSWPNVLWSKSAEGEMILSEPPAEREKLVGSWKFSLNFAFDCAMSWVPSSVQSSQPATTRPEFHWKMKKIKLAKSIWTWRSRWKTRNELAMRSWKCD